MMMPWWPVRLHVRGMPLRMLLCSIAVATGFKGSRTVVSDASRLAQHVTMTNADFRRSSDLLGTGEAVSKRQIVNAMGRWRTRSDWNEGIGRKGLLDDYRSGDYYDEDVSELATNFDQPREYYIARRPQFLDFCERYGLVARWVHRENVGLLPFPDDEEGRVLAASVNATVAELNAEPVNEMAADVLFDAMSQTGLIGFAEQDEVDRARASFLTAEGRFDEDAFGASLVRSRLNTAAALSAARVLPALILGGIGYRYLPELLAMASDIEAQVKANWQYSPVASLIPIPILGYLALAASSASERSSGTTGQRELNYQERAILQRDEYYRERMRLKKSGDLEATATPRFDELFQEESYWDKVRAGKAGMRWQWAKPSVPPEEKAIDASSKYSAGENAQKWVEYSGVLMRFVLRKAADNAAASRQPVSTGRSSSRRDARDDKQDEMQP
jgi:hypothetical protein